MRKSESSGNKLTEEFVINIAKCDVKNLCSLLEEARKDRSEEQYSLLLDKIFANDSKADLHKFFCNKLGYVLKSEDNEELISLKLDMINGIWGYIPDKYKDEWARSFLHTPVFNNIENKNTNKIIDKVIIAAIDIFINTTDNPSQKEIKIKQGVITFLENMNNAGIVKDIKEILLASLLPKPDKFTLFMKACYKDIYANIDDEKDRLKLDQYIGNYSTKLPLEIFPIIRSFLIPPPYIKPTNLKHQLVDDSNNNTEAVSSKKQKSVPHLKLGL